MRAHRRITCALAVLVLAVSLAGQASANGSGERRILRVAVYVDRGFGGGQSLVDVLNTDPNLKAAELTQGQLESGGLRAFDCVVARLYGPPESGYPTAATVHAVQFFIGQGGGYVGEWWGAGAALSFAAPSIDGDYDVPARFLHVFTGGASDGSEVQTDNPITVLRAHPVVRGLPSVFSGEGGTEFFVRAAPPFDPSLLVLATYEGHGGTNAAIMVNRLGSPGEGPGNKVLLLFDAIDNPTDPELSILWKNSATFACTHP